MLIREERPGDEDAIHELTAVAFEPVHYSDGSEPAIVRALREAGDLTISLVAEIDGVIVGHVAFSPVAIDGVHDGWYGLGPISVAPDRQRRGIGKSLILKGLEMLRERGANGCALVGNPDVYSRVGFVSDGQLTYGDLDRKYVQRLVLAGPAPRGALTYAPAFEPDATSG